MELDIAFSVAKRDSKGKFYAPKADSATSNNCSSRFMSRAESYLQGGSVNCF